jgi:asparagine synthase (glutamine-hydrolysing)
MCGIAGFVDFNKRSSEDTLSSMSRCVTHRGPDGQGIYFTENSHAQVGLGHRRLSIIDLSASANQPMHFNKLHLVFNGEIYNYNEIRDNLIQKGHQFSTHSDSEVILHGWQEWKENAIHAWRGMFSVVMYDEEKEELICIRDRAGVKPFHYYWNNGIFIFGSELKSIVGHPAFEKKIDHDAVASFLQYGYISHPHTIFKNTFKLPPGHLLKLNLKTKDVYIEQYWNVYDYYNKPKLKIGLSEAIEETEKVLTNAFQYRMVADVPVGVFLSGGYDSSCVTSLLQKNSKDKIKTFTIGTTDQVLDEAPYAKEIAGHLGTDHTELYCTAKEALEIIPELPHFFDEPFADSSAIPTILVSRMARKKVTVALSADGGDEIFAGYNRYDYISRYGDKIRSIPKPVRKLAAATMEKISSQNIPYFRSKRNFHSRYDKLKNLLHDPSTSELLKNLNHVFNRKEINNLFTKDIHEIKTSHSSTELKNEYYDHLSFMMAIDYQTYMVDDILQKVDRATMSVSLEGREPFLDQEVIQWAAQLPTDYKYRNGQKKFILKEIVHRHIPREMMERPKMGFGIPVETWMKNELRDLVEEAFSDKNLEHGIFNTGEVKTIVKDFLNGRSEKYLKVWYLLMFQLWYQKWMH